MSKTLKTAPELERYILNELRNCSGCNSISAVTVSAGGDPSGRNWDVTHIQVPGGVVPPSCLEICSAAVAKFRERFNLVTEIEGDEL